MNIEKYRYKTELHLHTSPASRCAEVPPEQAVELYAKLGYHSIVVSNHFFDGMRSYGNKKQAIEAYLADYDQTVIAGKKYGVHVILGCEVRFTENINDYLLFGIDRDELSEVYDRLELGTQEFSKWFRREDRLFIQAHPFRNGITRIPPEYLDGVESFNMHPHHNSRVGFAAKYAKQHNLIPTAGTDYHHLGHEGMAALLTKTEISTSWDIVDVLRSRDYLFEIGGCVMIP